MNIIPLFASNVVEIYIDPNQFEKHNIVNTVIENYQINPLRNNWTEKLDNIHHYYKDWENDKFKKIDLQSLINIYDTAFNAYFLKIASQAYNFSYEIVNVNAFGADQFMGVHEHYGSGESFFAIHYLKVPKNSSLLTLYNPLTVIQYPNTPDILNIQKVSNHNLIENSCFFLYYELLPKEDHLYIFPSYLKHSVPKGNNKDLRIAVASNIKISKQNT